MKRVLYDLLRRNVGSERAKALTANLLAALRVAPVTDVVVRRALALPFRDLEDAVCHSAAQEVNATVIVTRNTDDFKAGTIPAVLPEVFTQGLSNELRGG